jgi:DME family drug/metabolite transporter
MPAAEFVAVRLSLAAVALWLIVLAMRPDARLRVVGWRPLVMGLLEPGLVTFLVSLGLTMTSPVSASVFWGVTPLIMPLLGRVVLGEPIEPIVLGAAVFAFSGIAVLAWGQSHHGGGSVMGDALVAAGIMASVLNGLIARRNAQAGASPLVTASWQLTTACLVVAVLLAIMPAQGPALSNAGSSAMAVLLYLGLVVSAGVYLLSNYAVRHLPVARMSLLGCVTAPLGAALSALFLGTEVTALDAMAIALVIGSVALPTYLKFRSPAAVEPER